MLRGGDLDGGLGEEDDDGGEEGGGKKKKKKMVVVRDTRLRPWIRV